MSKSAATAWFRYDPDSPFAPEMGEWCLWSRIIDGERNYFSGRLFASSGEIYLRWDGGRSYTVNDTVYWARVEKLSEVQE